MVVETARKYIGQTEIPGNKGFNNLDFQTKMLAVGFQSGNAWCAYFAELVAKEAIPSKFKDFDKLFSASAVTTFNNFKTAKYDITDYPRVGNVVIWQEQSNGKPSWTGHVGIVTQAISKTAFKSVEGNTNTDGGREGYIVAEKNRTVKKVQNGLQVLGFIKID